MADLSGFSGFVPMTNPNCQMWVDWDTSRAVSGGKPGWNIHLKLKANRTAGYTTYGTGTTRLTAGTVSQYTKQYMEITANEKVFMERTYFVAGSVTNAGNYVPCEGHLDIPTVSSAAVRFNAIVKENATTISFDANRGSGAPSPQTKYWGIVLTLPNTIPTRSGYYFSAWSTTIDGTGTRYLPSGKYPTDGNRTLYAVWNPNTYTINFNGNGGTGVPAPFRKTHGVATTVPATRPTRTGYTFLGWNTSANGAGSSFQPSSAFTIDGDVTLYAIWKIDTYPIYYDANGGTGAPATQNKTYGQNITLSTQKPTRRGYSFLGWSTSQTGGVQYNAGGLFTSNYSVYLYAVWSRNVVTIMFDANGGVSTEPTRNIYQYDTIGNFPSATRTNYKFIGWSLNPQGTQFINTSYSVSTNITVYAIWELQANCYTKTEGKQKAGMMYLKSSGHYRTGVVYCKVSGRYRPSNM